MDARIKRVIDILEKRENHNAAMEAQADACCEPEACGKIHTVLYHSAASKELQIAIDEVRAAAAPSETAERAPMDEAKIREWLQNNYPLRVGGDVITGAMFDRKSVEEILHSFAAALPDEREAIRDEIAREIETFANAETIPGEPVRLLLRGLAVGIRKGKHGIQS